MSIRYAAAAALALSALSSNAMAANPADSQAKPAEGTQNAAAAQQDAKTRKVCHMETPTGSIFSKRVCVTAAEAEQAQASAREALDRAQRNGGTQTP